MGDNETDEINTIKHTDNTVLTKKDSSIKYGSINEATNKHIKIKKWIVLLVLVLLAVNTLLNISIVITNYQLKANLNSYTHNYSLKDQNLSKDSNSDPYKKSNEEKGFKENDSHSNESEFEKLTIKGHGAQVSKKFNLPEGNYIFKISFSNNIGDTGDDYGTNFMLRIDEVTGKLYNDDHLSNNIAKEGESSQYRKVIKGGDFRLETEDGTGSSCNWSVIIEKDN